jgi:hypothetical protein
MPVGRWAVDAQFPPRKDQLEVFVISCGAMGVVVVARHFGELAVVLLHKRWHEHIGSLDSAGVFKTQLLDQAILQRLVGSFNAALWRLPN